MGMYLRNPKVGGIERKEENCSRKARQSLNKNKVFKKKEKESGEQI